ncbi:MULTISPECIES: WhiB family transcriptional regulator [Rhodococcus]|nr:hypothetical protein CJ177_23585 [Rhodococcus sp. ACPA1]RZK72300.1 MAG: hypothetical protein EOP25_01960 [Rhodococcus sp. (in: high G+C Gram-positive bacteria)]UDH01103.1 WhiB family transcriptional regulator [Rhodococcus opacus PD630]
MCDGCPVQSDCRAHAFGVGKRYGVWLHRRLRLRREAQWSLE